MMIKNRNGKNLKIIFPTIALMCLSNESFGMRRNQNTYQPNYYGYQNNYYYNNQRQQYNPYYVNNVDEEEEENFKQTNTISFYTGQIPKLYTNQALSEYGLEIVNLVDFVSQKCSLLAIFPTIIGLVGNYVYLVYNFSYLAIGRGLRIKSLQLNYELALLRKKQKKIT